MTGAGAPLGRPPRAVADAPAVSPDAVAKAWLLELVAAAPLADSAALPVAALAAEGPVLCAALLAAVRTDDGLVALHPGGAASTVAARCGALAGVADPAGTVGAAESLRRAAWRTLAAAFGGEPEPAMVAELGDRLAHVCALVAQASVAGPQVTVAGCLERHARDGAPFSLLLAEVDNVERLLAAEPGELLAEELVRVEGHLIEALGAASVLTRERPGGWTIVAPGADATSARHVATRLAETFAAHAPRRHGVALTLSVGVATCPADALDAVGLEAHATGALFTARSNGGS